MSSDTVLPDEPMGTHQKALWINRDAGRYGTFAEIGAGQEVARWFFRVGGASHTVAKTISAYDMTVSDAIYGPAERYVSRQRLTAMLDHEYELLLRRLDATRGERTCFFVFANTVATRNPQRATEGHGWVGIRFQTQPRVAPSEIVMHVRTLDAEPPRQQEALGVIGVNLIYGACYRHTDPPGLIRSLLDNLTWQRVEVDMIEFRGPAFAGVDNRLMALQLVEQDLTEAAMFTADGQAVQWAEVLHKKPVLVLRGSFRPVTRATLDVLERAREQFVAEPELRGEPPVVLLEMTLRHLIPDDPMYRDFLDRADMLRVLGWPVLISNFRRFHRLAAYLGRYTNRPLGLAMGTSKLHEIFNESFYNDDEGGLLGGLGQLFKNPTRLYVYPSIQLDTGQVITAHNFPVKAHLRHLYAHLRENRFIVELPQHQPSLLPIRARAVLARIQSGDPTWEQDVPPTIVRIIKEKRLFGYRPAS